MKKLMKQFFVTAVALSALTACSDSTFSEVESTPVPSFMDKLPMYSSVLTDANNQQLSSVSADMGTYYLNIKTDGVWYIEPSNNMEFTPTKMCGIGSARVPVYEGSQTVNQESGNDIEGFKKLLNSNIFVGYGYYANKNTVPELCTCQQIFKMSATDPNVISSISPGAKEEYFYAHSEEVLDKVVNVNGHPGGNFGAVKMSLDLDNADVTRKSSFNFTIMQKSLTRSVYSREINFADMQQNQDNFTDGFKAYKEAFITKFNAATTDADKEKVAQEFFMVYGSHFVTKAFFGCELHYRMAVAATKAKKATDVKAALDFKWKQQVKDTAGVDSAQLDSLKKLLADSVRKNFVFHGGVMVRDSTFSAASSTQAQLNARGNDVKKVSILTTGGELKCDDLAAWMLGAKPEEAVMTGFDVQPIYVLFNGKSDAEQKAYKDLKELIDKSYKLDRAKDGFGKLDN